MREASHTLPERLCGAAAWLLLFGGLLRLPAGRGLALPAPRPAWRATGPAIRRSRLGRQAPKSWHRDAGWISCRHAEGDASATDVAEVVSYTDALQVFLAAQSEDPAKVRATFRRLARTMHPDVAGDSEEAAERFRGLVAAYDAVVKGEGRKALATAQKAGPSIVRDIALSGSARFDAWREGTVTDGDVVLYRLRDSDLEEFGLESGVLWGLAVVLAQQIRYTIGAPCGFIYGQRLVFEQGGSTSERYQRGWLVTEDSNDMALIDPMTEVEVLPVYTSPRYGGTESTDEVEPAETRYQVSRAVDTRYVWTTSRG